MKRNLKLLIDGKVCTVSQRPKEQGSGRTFLYWYAYWNENGRQRNKYLGKEDPRSKYQVVQEAQA